ncbi:MAG TPA: thiamine-phosphate kinase [Candidatus Acidoferrum sp.]|nr:thiamine-phosphate kinase [Candidatus Acidoferrum sp.]
MDTEGQLVRRIAQNIPHLIVKNGVSRNTLGIGDDAAVVSPRLGASLVVTCDSFFEGVHFLADFHPPDSIGYKSVARAASDIAAMGALPRWFVLALALPSHLTGSWLDRLSQGIGKAARELGLTLIGGDMTKSSHISLTITVLGEIAPARAVTRSGARPGDLLYASGVLGEAQLGLEWIRSGVPIPRKLPSFLRQHLYPQIPLELGAWLAHHQIPSAMMDLSDGLSTDLPRLCESSGVGARINSRRLPCVEIPSRIPARLRRAKLDPLSMALNGGDDYALLFTVRPQLGKRLRAAPGFRRLVCIGEITQERKVVLVDEAGNEKLLASHGWDPFLTR